MLATNNKVSIGGEALKLTASKMITLLIGMVSAMLLARFRSLKEYGTYSQLLMIINLVTSIMMLGLPKSINYFLARAESEEERNAFLSVYYTFNTTLSIVVGITLVFSAPLLIKYFNNPLISNFIYFLAVYPWAKIIASSIENVLIVYEKTILLMKYRILNSLALLSIIIIVQVFHWSFNVYMILFAGVEGLFALAVYMIVNKLTVAFKFYFNRKLIIQILSFSIPIGLASVVGTLNIELDKFMIGRFMSTEQLAIYTNASKEMPVAFIASSLTAVLLPHMAILLKRNKGQKAIELWGASIILSFVLICFLATGFFTFAPEVMTLLYSEKYLPGVSVFRIYNLVLLLRCTYFGMILNANGKTRFILYSSIASLLLNISLNYLLYRMIGFEGPAIATFTSMLIIIVGQLFYTSKCVDIPFGQIFPWTTVLKILVQNIVLGVVFYTLKKVIPLEIFLGSIAEAIVFGIVWGAVYLGLNFKILRKSWDMLKAGGGVI